LKPGSTLRAAPRREGAADPGRAAGRLAAVPAIYLTV